MERITRALLGNPVPVLVTAIALGAVGIWAYRTLPVDVLPDITENQVIVAVEWPGTSPVDIEDQVTYPLVSSLRGLPGVRQVRAASSFGYTQIYIVFDDGIDLYWARTRVSERLSEAAPTLPEGASVMMGPDATPLGEIYWYVVEGPYDLGALRSIQDYVIKPALESVPGVAEISSNGGFIREYQVSADPELLRHYGLTLGMLGSALETANQDVGGGTVEASGMEFVVRGIGRIRSIEDIELTPVAWPGGRPLFVSDVASVALGPAFRRGALADENGELVGGIVMMRVGADPVRVIEGVEGRIAQISAGLPAGVTITPYYDRRLLIDETIGTLTDSIIQEIFITLAVILVFLVNLRTSFIVASTLPFAVLLAFIGMRLLGVGANIMSFAGIAIAIGTLVDMGIIVSESIHQGLAVDGTRASIPRSVAIVAPAIATSLLTTIVGFVPVFFLQGQSGRLFVPLAWTKTLALASSGIIALTLVPVLISITLAAKGAAESHRMRALIASTGLGLLGAWVVAGLVPDLLSPLKPLLAAILAGVAVGLLTWRIVNESLESRTRERIGSVLVDRIYLPLLDLAVRHRGKFLTGVLVLTLMGFAIAAGAPAILQPLDRMGLDTEHFRPTAFLRRVFPGIGTQFMPPLDEGSFLFMPSLLSQASLDQTVDVMIRQNAAMAQIPEVASVVGKAGRSDTPLDPAFQGMIETVITLRPRDEWREGITSSDILAELRNSVRMPGIVPSWLQPIETRIVMLQSGIRTNIGLEIHGTDVDEIERVAVAIERVLSGVPGATNVSAQRGSRRPYVNVRIDRQAAALYGLSVADIQHELGMAMAGMVATTVIDGRQRIPVRIRYARDMRDNIEDIPDIYVPTPGGAQVLLSQLAAVETTEGPASIRSVDGELVGYVTLSASGRDEGGLVDQADSLLRAAVEADSRLSLEERAIDLPAGYSFRWIGNYQNQIEARNRFRILIPICLASIFFLMYLQFRTFSIPAIIFLGNIPLEVAGGFFFIWLWPGIHSFLWSIGMIGVPPEGAVYITVAVAVGFIALLGVCVDDGVLISTYISQLKEERGIRSRKQARAIVREAGSKRIRPAVMTVTTTVIALIPVILASGRGADLSRPMALPVFGGMLLEFITMLIVPVAYGWWLERGLPEEAPEDRVSQEAPAG
jgi:Cu(I)/Ag(I) efflux system membrane protein CusA/SilA